MVGALVSAATMADLAAVSARRSKQGCGWSLFKDKGNSFCILSLNCQSINAKFDQRNIKVQQLKNNGYEFSAICLQETWLSSDSDTSLF